METPTEPATDAAETVYPDGSPTGPPPCIPASITSVLMDAADQDLTPVCLRLTGLFYDRLCIAFGGRFTQMNGVPVNVLPPGYATSRLLAHGPHFPMRSGGLYLPFDDAESLALPSFGRGEP